jgi:predicted Zn-dependent peptidase
MWIGAATAEPSKPISIELESYTLDNGLHVVLLEDHSTPAVVTNLMYRVGSKDEAPGRSGFAHLFEHLMFMGTTRLPGSGFDDLMEGYGGWNNAWTSEDATDYFDVGPSNLRATFLWMEADRLDGLSKAMTQEKLDLQRDVVRNERRQTSEDEPYGVLWLELPQVMYPAGHPYAHSVIGTHEDLQAASVADVVSFFDTWYVPNNASLVVAGDIDKAATKAEIARLFGPLPRRELPARPTAPSVDKPAVAVKELTDQVQTPMTTLLWHTPARLAPGDAALDVVANILGGGRSSRLYVRLVEGNKAQEVSATQVSQHLTSLFVIDAKPTEGHTIEEIEAAITEELGRLAKDGPTPAEMERVKNQLRYTYLTGLEGIADRALAINQAWYTTGDPNTVNQHLSRYEALSAADIRAAAATLSADRRAIIRVRPEATK